MVQSPRQPGDLADEIAQISLAPSGVCTTSGWNISAVITAPLVGDHGERRIRRHAGDVEARRHRGDAVAVAHPDRMPLARSPRPHRTAARGLRPRHRRGRTRGDGRLRPRRRAARHRHLAVADAEHRHAGVEDRLRRARRAGLVHRCRAAGQDDRLRLHLAEGRFRLLERHDLAIDALLAHAARDQLRHLAAEIDDQNLVMRRGHRGHRLAGWLDWGHGQGITRPRPASQCRKSPCPSEI